MSGKNNVNLAQILLLGRGLQYLRINLYRVLDDKMDFVVRGGEYTSVKGSLQVIYNIIMEYNIAPKVQTPILNWINNLDNFYVKEPEGRTFFNTTPIHINSKDGTKLLNDINHWKDEISNSLETDFYAPPQIDTAFTDKSKLTSGIESFLKDDSLKIISENAKQDLNEAIKCILYSLPTPAAMITFRASEEVLRSYYEKKTPNSAEGKRWYEIIQELSKKEGANKPFVDYLNYIRDKRNEAEHPGKIFTQSESEHAFMQVIHLIEVISKDIK